MSIHEATHRMTPKEQEIFDIGCAKGKADAMKHGKWIEKSDFITRTSDFKCSICSSWTPYYGGYKYCPNCGARMDGEV